MQAWSGLTRLREVFARLGPELRVHRNERGTWSLRDSTLTISPFRPLSTVDTTATLDEAERLLAFLGPAASGGIRLD